MEITTGRAPRCSVAKRTIVLDHASGNNIRRCVHLHALLGSVPTRRYVRASNARIVTKADLGQLRTKRKVLSACESRTIVIIARNHMYAYLWCALLMTLLVISSLMRGGRFAWLALQVGDYSIISRRDGALLHKRANVAPSVAKTSRESNPKS